jgi:hypothetical protein
MIRSRPSKKQVKLQTVFDSIRHTVQLSIKLYRVCGFRTMIRVSAIISASHEQCGSPTAFRNSISLRGLWVMIKSSYSFLRFKSLPSMFHCFPSQVVLTSVLRDQDRKRSFECPGIFEGGTLEVRGNTTLKLTARDLTHFLLLTRRNIDSSYVFGLSI